MRSRTFGAGIALSAALVTGVSLSPQAHAATVWDRVAACESTGNWGINSGNGYYGGLQFSASTWRQFGGARYAPSANLAGKAAQIAIARRVLATQGPGAWPSCGPRAGLTRASGGAARAAGTAKAVTVSRSRTAVSRSTARVAPVVSHGRLVVDGVLGPKTTQATQRWVGAPQTSVFGPITARALQRRVGAQADGVVGPRTIRALQTRIGAPRDGVRRLNAATVAALQSYLNRH